MIECRLTLRYSVLAMVLTRTSLQAKKSCTCKMVTLW